MKITLLSVALVACSTATWSWGVDQETATVEWLLLGRACFLWRHRTSSFGESRWAWFEVCLRYLFMWRENTDLEDDLSTARVFFNLKRRNLSSKPCEVASLYFFQLGFLNFLFFFPLHIHCWIAKISILKSPSAFCIGFTVTKPGGY